MTRGNQRDLARAKSQKKLEQLGKKKGTGDKGSAGKSLEDRRQRDAEAMRLKQKKAEEKKSAEGAAGGKK